MTLWGGVPSEYSRGANGVLCTAGACPLDVDRAVVAPGDHEAVAAC